MSSSPKKEPDSTPKKSQQPRNSLGGGKGFSEESFSHGDLSAKQILNRHPNTEGGSSVASNVICSSSLQRLPSSGSGSVAVGSVLGSSPLTLSGGFHGLDPTKNKIDVPRSKQSRRQSVLSDMISTSHAARNDNSSPQLQPAQRSEQKEDDVSRSTPSVASPARDIRHPDVLKTVEKHLANENEIDSSLHLQGGDVTRGIYQWVNGESSQKDNAPLKRASSFNDFSVHGEEAGRADADQDRESVFDEDDISIDDIKVPGGMRRSFLLQKHRDRQLSGLHKTTHQPKHLTKPNFFTNNFIEFLALYGHFAGEDLEEDEDEDLDSGSESVAVSDSEGEFSEADNNLFNDEESLLLAPSTSNYARSRIESIRTPTYGSFSSNVGSSSIHHQLMKSQIPKLRKRGGQHKHKTLSKLRSKKQTTTVKAVLLLLKAFIGTGVLFLPKSFSNGGLLFSSGMLLIFSCISIVCFIELIQVGKLTQIASYGDIGGYLYGRTMKASILTSIILSQIGFASAYIVFVAENARVLCDSWLNLGEYSIEVFIFLQLIVFVPLSLTRDINKLSFTALVADLFILAGLILVYYYSTYHLVVNGISKNVSLYNESEWPLFIGVAVFTYEGIGLLIPINESMAKPEKFNKSLVGVMAVITVVFISIGSIAYMSFGSDVNTVILLNFPQNNKVFSVQLLYAIAIMLSTPLQLFPAIKIIENFAFKKRKHLDSIESKNNRNTVQAESENVFSGKHNTRIKWSKNLLRVVIVIGASIISYAGSSDLDKFVALIGSFTCIPLIYVYPPLLHIKGNLELGTLSKTNMITDMVICALGATLMLYTGFQGIKSWIG
ncbi:BA75_00312T0 [Komagataella pastoris]|uniref:BA75_00312T0 n=1 Tax=Komagataella pastoris TaxID=4922 RepID=A0A1B2J9T8_PICPA|nr:BA75_00312T0 [Komagataella pastoris]